MFGIFIDINTEFEDPRDFFKINYYEIEKRLGNLGFTKISDSFYILKQDENSLASVYKAIKTLANISWLKKCVRDVKTFKIEDFSDFTDIVKRE